MYATRKSSIIIVSIILTLVVIGVLRFIPYETRYYEAYCPTLSGANVSNVYDGIPERYSLLFGPKFNGVKLKNYPPPPNALCSLSDFITVKFYVL